MSTENKELDSRFDARVISLYSRGIQDKMPRNLKGANSFYSFCYYDAIKVSKVHVGSGPVLKSAYAQAHKPLKKPYAGCSFRQLLVSVVDIVSDQDTCHGYTAKQIERFWKNAEHHPLFFVSMINLNRSEDLDIVLEDIRKIFPFRTHLAYLTFDHCDLILFSYGDSFQEHTNRIFKLYYGGRRALEDIITLYSFSTKGNLEKCDKQFSALLRIGVHIYPQAKEFLCKLENLGVPFQVNRLLGRNDLSIYCQEATLRWLSQVRETLIQMEQGNTPLWYTTYDLTVFALNHTDDIDANGQHSLENYDCKKLRKRMEDKFRNFKRNYFNSYKHLQEAESLSLTPNNIWLRWLEESCTLAVTLMESRLSIDLATCLVPQFLDLLDYASVFFSCKDLIRRDDIEKIHKSFSTFFSNIAILVDSMNQTNLQFVQVPAFHLPSFEIPPQILAYYTVLAHRLREVFQDDPDTIYSLTISPDLVNTLSVSSLANQWVLSRHQWISMSMDETSFYTIKLTTETIAHEISHFIGQQNRHREWRKECIMRCAFQLLLGEVLFQLWENQVGNASSFDSMDFLELASAAERLWNQAIVEYKWKYSTEQALFTKDLSKFLPEIPQDILHAPKLASCLSEEIWGLMEKHLKHFQPLLDQLEASCLISGGSIPEDINCLNLLRAELNKAVVVVLQTLIREFNDSSPVKENAILSQQFRKLPGMFSETFADLQAVLLLNMELQDYYRMFQREDGKGIVQDCPIRMLAVTNILVRQGKQLPKSLEDGDSQIKVICSFAQAKAEKDASKLAMKNFNPEYFHYLTEYLWDCSERIKTSFSDKEKLPLVEELQELHSQLSDKTPLMNLQKAILSFTDAYRSALLGTE